MSRAFNTSFVIAVVVGAMLGVAGVLHYQNTNDRATVTVGDKELQKTTEHSVKVTEEIGGQGYDSSGATVQGAMEDTRQMPHERHASATTSSPTD